MFYYKVIRTCQEDLLYVLIYLKIKYIIYHNLGLDNQKYI